MERNRLAWDVAARKYEEESERLISQALSGPALVEVEREVLAPIVGAAGLVVHLQSGHGLEDLDLARLGARVVVGIDFSVVTASAADARARLLDVPVRYAVSECLTSALRSGCADLVYTGKGALMWLPDIGAWANEVARLLRPGGRLFLYEAHPAATLWSRDPDGARLRPDRSYFHHTRVNDTFPASAIERYAAQPGVDAVEWQWTLADVVNSLIDAGLQLEQLYEHPEPFWQPDHGKVPAWDGRLPNSFSLLATAGQG